MDKQEQIRKGLRRLAAGVGPAPMLLGTVTSVDKNERTCVISDDEIDTPDVRLRPVIDNSEGLTLFPAVGAQAVAVRMETDDEWLLIAATSYDKWQLVIDTATIEQDTQGLLIQKGADTLKDILTNVIQSVMQIAVIYGNNPDYAKLQTALTQTQNLLR